MLAQRRSRATVAAVTAAALCYCVLASYTRPFTLRADIVTAVPVAAGGLITALRSSGAKRSVPAAPSDAAPGRATGRSTGSIPWVVAIVTVTTWELYCFASGPRSAHPTLSTFIDLLDSTRPGKTIGCALWLALGCYLVML